EEPDDITEWLAPAVHLLAARRGHLARRELHHRPSRVVDELVRGVEVGLVRGHAHSRANAERIDRRAAAHEVVDLELVETAAHEDANVLHTFGVEEPACAIGELEQVAAVQPHTRAAAHLQLPDDLDRVLY